MQLGGPVSSRSVGCPDGAQSLVLDILHEASYCSVYLLVLWMFIRTVSSCIEIVARPLVYGFQIKWLFLWRDLNHILTNKKQLWTFVLSYSTENKNHYHNNIFFFIFFFKFCNFAQVLAISCVFTIQDTAGSRPLPLVLSLDFHGRLKQRWWHNPSSKNSRSFNPDFIFDARTWNIILLALTYQHSNKSTTVAN